MSVFTQHITFTLLLAINLYCAGLCVCGMCVCVLQLSETAYFCELHIMFFCSVLPSLTKKISVNV